MRPRSGYRSVLLLALAASLLASCASSPPRRDETPQIREIRDDYLRAHPNGRFNAEIARGEIVAGMGYNDVLAAWGMPDTRVSDGEPGEEWWTYVITSDNGADWVRYDFVFAERTVVEWAVSRAVASGFVPVRDDPRGVPRRVPPTSPPALGDGVRKGGAGSMIR